MCFAYLNYILFFISDEKGNTGVGQAETCVKFDDIQVTCTSGVCRNISEVYKCNFRVSTY